MIYFSDEFNIVDRELRRLINTAYIQIYFDMAEEYAK